jgi:hypothetical protein
MLGVFCFSSNIFESRKNPFYFSLHSQLIEKRQEQNLIIDKTNTIKYNHHRNIAKITEQCANLTLAFRTNYHAYVNRIYEKYARNKTNPFDLYFIIPLITPLPSLPSCTWFEILCVFFLGSS